MATVTFAFISGTTFFPCRPSRLYCLHSSSFLPSLPRVYISPRRRIQIFQMRNRPPRSPFSPRTRTAPDFQKWARRAEKLWTRSSLSERSVVGLGALGVIAVAGVAINVIFHVSLALAFFIIPILFAPILLTILASVSVFAMMTFATAGAGFFFIGTPFLAFAMLTKVLFPFAILAGAAGVVAKKLLGWGIGDSFDEEFGDEEELEEQEVVTYDKGAAEKDAFDRFDAELGYRGKPNVGRGRDVMMWDLSDVVDELDYKGLGEYRQLFIEERIDGRTLLTLTDDDIKVEFGTTMPLGDRVRLSQLVSELRRLSSRLP